MFAAWPFLPNAISFDAERYCPACVCVISTFLPKKRPLGDARLIIFTKIWAILRLTVSYFSAIIRVYRWSLRCGYGNPCRCSLLSTCAADKTGFKERNVNMTRRRLTKKALAMILTIMMLLGCIPMQDVKKHTAQSACIILQHTL